MGGLTAGLLEQYMRYWSTIAEPRALRGGRLGTNEMDSLPARPCPLPARDRRLYLEANELEVTEVLRLCWMEAAADLDRWAVLRWRNPSEAVRWCVERWGSEDFDELVTCAHLIVCEDPALLFGWTEFWERLRLQALSQEDSNDRRIAGRSRRELAVHDDYQPVVEGWVEPTFTDGLAAEVERLVEVLEHLGRRTHREVEVLWLEHHAELRDILAGAKDVSRQRGRPPAASAAVRSKERALAAFRFIILFDGLEPEGPARDELAFAGMYLTCFEKPDWPARPRDRWDVIPKRVVSRRLRAAGHTCSPNEVVRGALVTMARLVERVLQRGERAAAEQPSGSALDAHALYLLLLRGSVVRTLRDEYARKGRTDGPTAARIEAWQEELDEARRELGERWRAS